MSDADQLGSAEFERWWSEFRREHPEWEPHVDLLVRPPSVNEALQDYPELESSEVLAPRRTSYGVTRLALYYLLRRGGQTHRFAEMVSCQRGPALMTDAVFFQGMPTLDKQFVDAKQREQVLAVARRHGYEPGPHDVYEPGLARFQGDPEAFVPPTGGRGHIRRVCEKRGWACHGAVEISAEAPRKDPYENYVPLAEDIVQRNVREAVKADPSLAKLSRSELRERIIDKHGAKYDGAISTD